MLNDYYIQSMGGLPMGVWRARSSVRALLALHRSRGFCQNLVWVSMQGEMQYKDEDWRDFIGPESEWNVKLIGPATKTALRCGETVQDDENRHKDKAQSNENKT